MSMAQHEMVKAYGVGRPGLVGAPILAIVHGTAYGGPTPSCAARRRRRLEVR